MIIRKKNQFHKVWVNQVTKVIIWDKIIMLVEDNLVK